MIGVEASQFDTPVQPRLGRRSGKPHVAFSIASQQGAESTGYIDMEIDGELPIEENVAVVASEEDAKEEMSQMHLSPPPSSPDSYALVTPESPTSDDMTEADWYAPTTKAERVKAAEETRRRKAVVALRVATSQGRIAADKLALETEMKVVSAVLQFTKT